MSLIGSPEIDELAELLRVYDVVDGGWEHEGKGFKFNGDHILDEMVRGETDKDFTKSEVLRTDIVPDRLQYGLRLARWTGQSASELERMGVEDQFEVNKLGHKLPGAAADYLVAMRARSVLAGNMHDLGHPGSQEEAAQLSPEVARRAGGLLVASAEMAAAAHSFDLAAAFAARIINLRQRFLPHTLEA